LNRSTDGEVGAQVVADNAAEPMAERVSDHQLEQLNDEELTEILIVEQQAFVVLYQRYVTRVYSYFAWRFGQRHAEDLTSDVFTRALAARSSFEIGRAWRPWLFGIARNRALEHLRTLKRDSSEPEFTELDMKESATDVSAEVVFDEQAKAVRQIVATLPDSQREAVELRFWAGLSYREITEVLGGSEGALRVQIHRTLRVLRDRIEGAT